MSKTFVITDIHGCLQALEDLLDKLQPDLQQDSIIFLGDYIDRGPASSQVIEKIISLKAQAPSIITLIGNHEQMLLDFLADSKTDTYLQFGGRETLQSYGWQQGMEASDLIPAKHKIFFRELLTYWQDDNYMYVHAGLEPGVHLSRQSREWLLWARDGGGNKACGKTIIHGHTVYPKPLVTSARIGIDTGAVYGGKLTCLILPDLEFISVKSKKFWSVPNLRPNLR